MTSSQCSLLPKVGVQGKHMLKKSLSLKISDQATVLLLTPCCLALPNVQSLHGMNVSVAWIPMALAVAWAIDLNG